MGRSVLEHRLGDAGRGARGDVHLRHDPDGGGDRAGTLLSRSGYRAMTDPSLLGFGHSQANCRPACFAQTRFYNFGLGVVRMGSPTGA